VEGSALRRILLALCVEGFGAGFEDGRGCGLEDAAEVAVVAGDVVEVGVDEIEAGEGAVVEEGAELGGCGGDGVEFVGEGGGGGGVFGAFPAGHGFSVMRGVLRSPWWYSTVNFANTRGKDVWKSDAIYVVRGKDCYYIIVARCRLVFRKRKLD